MDYLSLPLTLRKGYFDRVDLYESISCSVGLILSTRPNSIPFDPEFGCLIWEKEFSDLYSANKADIRAGIRNAIDKYEKRLYNLAVSIIEIENTPHNALGLAIKVSGNYRDDGEEKKFEETFHVG